MTTSKEQIEAWVNQGKKKKQCTHVLIVCDTFDWEDYPVYVTDKENIKERFDYYNGPNMQRVMEIYSMKLDIPQQLNEHRSWHLD